MPAIDQFQSYNEGLTTPASNAQEVSPSDGTDLTNTARALYVGTAGDLRVTMRGGAVVTFTGLSAGAFHPLRVSRVHATGTTASNIVAVW